MRAAIDASRIEVDVSQVEAAIRKLVVQLEGDAYAVAVVTRTCCDEEAFPEPSRGRVDGDVLTVDLSVRLPATYEVLDFHVVPA